LAISQLLLLLLLLSARRMRSLEHVSLGTGRGVQAARLQCSNQPTSVVVLQQRDIAQLHLCTWLCGPKDMRGRNCIELLHRRRWRRRLLREREPRYFECVLLLFAGVIHSQ